MCDHEDSPKAALPFAQFSGLLGQSPFEPCDSEIDFRAPEQYEEAFNEMARVYSRKTICYLARRTDDPGCAPDSAQELFFKLYRGSGQLRESKRLHGAGRIHQAKYSRFFLLRPICCAHIRDRISAR